MIKRMMALIWISFICLSLSVPADATTPENIKDALNKDLSHWQQQMQTLTTHSKQATQTNTLSDDKTTSSYLGDGYAKYNINVSSYSASQNTYVSSTNNSVLRFTGYVFLVEGKSGSTALAFADDPSDYKKITGLASSENFSDADFKIPMAKAKQFVGFNASSKLIYDEAHRIIALVTTTDQGEKVALLEASSPLGLKK
ncbi:hypothetical protein [Paenibacillus campi]|uniref:hypothetical protein n=1 Tax=Paenibacillus campi TaxID=3106031 RepID=UPI002AFF9FB8|nr:hypothetical protein [Paenibacillus sp. SGZ-1009]